MTTSVSPSPANPSPSSKLLVVDDNRDFVELLKVLLCRQGFDVSCAYSGPECLETVQREGADLIILDVMMPQMDGLQVCAELKRIAPSIPVILVTAKDDLATRAAAMALGVREYFTKPVNIQDFLTQVRTQLQIRRCEKNVEDAFSKAEQGEKSRRET